MEMIIWSDGLSNGNTDIDKVHKSLVDIYNDLIEYVESKRNRIEFAMMLSKMTDYSLLHFKKEEEYMQKMSYPELTAHKRFHRDYIYKVTMYTADLLGINPPEIKEVINFTGNWWVDHILKLIKNMKITRKKFILI